MRECAPCEGYHGRGAAEHAHARAGPPVDRRAPLPARRKPGELTMAIGTDILVVEDSPMQAEQLRGVLEANGHRVAAVRGGREALVAIRQRRPTLVITDIVMPEMGGYELCRQIKRDAELHDIPVMLMTSLSDPVDLIRGLECGADSFSVKPWEEGQLMARIAGISANRQLQAVDRAQRGIEIVFSN